ncbi:MAG: transporter substrate-binding domain-containing protein [Chlamydiales bacterium]
MTTNIERIKKRGKLLIGVVAGDVPGICFRNPKTNRVEGFEADLARLIAKELLGSENHAEFVEVLAHERVNSLKESREDLVISLFTITQERAAQVDFSDPYFIDEVSLLVLKGGPIKQQSDLKGEKIAVVETSVILPSLQEGFTEGQIVKVKSKADGIQAINEHRVDALANTIVNLSLMLNSLPDKERYTILGTAGRFPAKEYAVGIKKKSPDLVEFVNKALSKFKTQGMMNSLLKKHGWIPPEDDAH